jgi:hypothetical protein
MAYMRDDPQLPQISRNVFQNGCALSGGQAQAQLRNLLPIEWEQQVAPPTRAYPVSLGSGSAPLGLRYARPLAPRPRRYRWLGGHGHHHDGVDDDHHRRLILDRE